MRFSSVPRPPMVPGSRPPCPGSSTTRGRGPLGRAALALRPVAAHVAAQTAAIRQLGEARRRPRPQGDVQRPPATPTAARRSARPAPKSGSARPRCPRAAPRPPRRPRPAGPARPRAHAAIPPPAGPDWPSPIPASRRVRAERQHQAGLAPRLAQAGPRRAAAMAARQRPPAAARMRPAAIAGARAIHPPHASSSVPRPPALRPEPIRNPPPGEANSRCPASVTDNKS